jgi:ketosteroid isomerase-like protein
MASTAHEQITTPHTPAEVVQELFTALGSPDRQDVLTVLADDVEWWVAGPPEIPYAGTFRGHAEVAQFFAAFDGAIDYESWEAHQFITEGETVVVIGEERWRAKSTGKAADNPWVLVLTVREGKITQFRAYEDTAASRDAFLASDASNPGTG